MIKIPSLSKEVEMIDQVDISLVGGELGKVFEDDLLCNIEFVTLANPCYNPSTLVFLNDL